MYRVIISHLASSLPCTLLSHVGKVLLDMTKWLEVMMARLIVWSVTKLGTYICLLTFKYSIYAIKNNHNSSMRLICNNCILTCD